MPKRDDPERWAQQRRQVLRGVAEAVAAKGWSATTIADIAAAARASRTTVYAHFPDKDEALLALHHEVLDRLVDALMRAHRESGPDTPWPTRVRVTMDAYLEAMVTSSAGERASLLELASAGPEARRARRDGLDRFAEAVAQNSVELAASDPGAEPLTPSRALAAVASVNELVQRAAPDGPGAIRALAPDAADVFVRLMRRAPDHEPTPGPPANPPRRPAGPSPSPIQS
ncbi:TetR/AcrR family transcriptional regulator [Patulibacter americanus]|uniref:TetR/AcrR family transcriptional regulator n=1 Tax=Patulibacter americanus TaxID=588672 RepID=UPI0003B51705|nr:TetR/AcrR family transcriptional regulator [Patulibacter americanus]